MRNTLNEKMLETRRMSILETPKGMILETSRREDTGNTTIEPILLTFKGMMGEKFEEGDI